MLRHVLPIVDGSAETTIERSYSATLAEHDSGPWVGLCMVSSIDGSTVVDGNSGGLSSVNDAAVLRQLRSIADVVLVGAGTVRGEGYGPPKTPGQRIGVVTASGSVDTTTPLFTSGAGFLVVPEQTRLTGDAAAVDVIRAGTEAVDFTAVLEQLSDVHPNPRFVQAEGGARLNAALLDADMLDEINLTTSPLCVGGSGPRLTTGASDQSTRYELAQMVVDDQSFVFSRWRRRPAPTSP